MRLPLLDPSKLDEQSGFLRSLVTSQAEKVSVKSQVLRPLGVPLAIFLIALLAGLAAGVLWVQIFGGVGLLVNMVFYLREYLHWKVEDPDRLGTEAYVWKQSILKMAAKDPDLRPRIVQAQLIGNPSPKPKPKAIDVSPGPMPPQEDD